MSIKAHENAKQQRFMRTEECRNLFQIRNGVETLPDFSWIKGIPECFG